MEWDIRNGTVEWTYSTEDFVRAGSVSPEIQAFYRHDNRTIYLGPTVNDQNFDSIFGHELVHLIFHQKYRGAIPDWLEEGFANYLAQKGSVDYRWLAAQPRRDITLLSHPFKSAYGPRYAYSASQAAVEMIASHCSLTDLLQLSVGKSLVTYLKTYCEISDVNKTFGNWVSQRASAVASSKQKR